MTSKEVIEYSKELLKEQMHYLYHFRYLQRKHSPFIDYSTEIKNKLKNVNYLKAIIKRFEND